jgi:hypothetical protein
VSEAQPKETRFQMVERLLNDMRQAACTVMTESNGLSDNEWTRPDGTAIAEWPVGSFVDAMRDLEKAWRAASEYFDPDEARLRKKWGDACATASFIVDEFKARDLGNRSVSSLHRNIADAIYGTLTQTAEDRAANRRPDTMSDKLDRLVGEGKLVKFEAGSVPPTGGDAA